MSLPHLHPRRAAARALALVVTLGGLGAVGAPAHADDADNDAYFDRSVSVVDPVFFPRVRDDFKDHTVLHIDGFEYENAQAAISGEDGTTVRTLRFTEDDDRSTDVWEARWDGRDEKGRPVPVGTYTVALSADVDDYVDGEFRVDTVHATRTVRVASGIRNRPFVVERAAARTTQRSHGEGCRTREAGRDLVLVCRQGTRASASWRIALPKRATKVRWELVRDRTGDRGGRGRVIEEASRTGAGALVVTATVTGSRHQRYDAVVVRYLRRVRV